MKTYAVDSDMNYFQKEVSLKKIPLSEDFMVIFKGEIKEFPTIEYHLSTLEDDKENIIHGLGLIIDRSGDKHLGNCSVYIPAEAMKFIFQWIEWEKEILHRDEIIKDLKKKIEFLENIIQSNKNPEIYYTHNIESEK